ncbi:MAG: glycosyltransferase [Terriglobia bacterium]
MAARHSLLIVTDSDVSVGRGYLRAIASEFESPKTGLVTNLYRGIGGKDLWSKLEALGMSTEFMAGVVVADYLEGMKFSLGPSMGVRKTCLQTIGGFASLADYLADDFVLGEKIYQKGYTVVLSAEVISHHAYATGFSQSMGHRLRWNRSSRFSRPAGYFGQGFTYGLPWTLLLFLLSPTRWSAIALIASLFLRAWAAFLGTRLLEDPAVLPRFWLIPLQDCLSFASWVGGFFGREVTWRKVRYQILAQGRLSRIKAP